MDRSQQPLEWQGVPALIDQLIETADVGHRDRILLEAVASRPWTRGCAIWRPGSDGPEFGARWHQVLSRGDADALPERDAIHSIVRGERGGDFYAGVRVWLAGAGRGAFALAVASGEVPAGEDDLLESLLCLFAVLDEGAEREPWIPLLPAAESSRMEHDLRNLMTGIQATQELLACYGDELSEEELEHFSSLLDGECTRAGDLLGNALSARAPRAAQDEAADHCRPHALVTALVRELEAQGGATLRLTTDDRTDELECAVDREAVRPLLRDWLTELRRACAGVELALERSNNSADAPLLLRATRAGGDDDDLDASAHAARFASCGLRLAHDGGEWRLHFPARRSA